MNKDFKERVYAVVAQIPSGRLMSYGQIAALCGSPRAARVVGGVAHFGDAAMPWHRVVKRDGGLAEGYPGGVMGHKQALEAEGIAVMDNFKTDIKKLQWNPNR